MATQATEVPPFKGSLPELLNKRQAALRLTISVTSLDNYARRGFIKNIRIGRQVRFHREEIDRVMREGLSS